MFRRWIPFWAVPVVIVLAIGTVWLRLSIVGTTYSISQSERNIRELHHAREQAELRLTALRSPRRLEILAKTKFGLAPAKSEQIVHMSDPQSTAQSAPEASAAHAN